MKKEVESRGVELVLIFLMVGILLGSGVRLISCFWLNLIEVEVGLV